MSQEQISPSDQQEVKMLTSLNLIIEEYFEFGKNLTYLSELFIINNPNINEKVSRLSNLTLNLALPLSIKSELNNINLNMLKLLRQFYSIPLEPLNLMEIKLNLLGNIQAFIIKAEIFVIETKLRLSNQYSQQSQKNREDSGSYPQTRLSSPTLGIGLFDKNRFIDNFDGKIALTLSSSPPETPNVIDLTTPSTNSTNLGKINGPSF